MDVDAILILASRVVVSVVAGWLAHEAKILNRLWSTH